MVLLNNGETYSQIVSINPIISIHKSQILPLCVVQSKIASRTYSTIPFMEDLDPMISLSILIANLTAAIRRAIIKQKQLPVRIGLSDDAINASSYIFLRLIDRNDYADFRH